MTIIDKIAENAQKYPDRIMYHTESPECLDRGVSGVI